MISVQYYPVDQVQKLFVPQNARIIKPLKRNVLYPFFVYNSEDEDKSSEFTVGNWLKPKTLLSLKLK